MVAMATIELERGGSFMVFVSRIRRIRNVSLAQRRPDKFSARPVQRRKNGTLPIFFSHADYSLKRKGTLPFFLLLRIIGTPHAGCRGSRR